MKGHARNLMTERVVAFEPDTKVQDLIDIFVSQGLSGAPIVDKDHRVLGLVSEADMLAALLKHDPKRLTAAEVMTTPAIVVDEFAPTSDVINLLSEHRIHHLPVVRKGRIVGFITPRDILRYFVKQVLPPAPETA